MRTIAAVLVALLFVSGTAAGAAPGKKRPDKQAEAERSEDLLRWISGYRARPDLDRVLDELGRVPVGDGLIEDCVAAGGNGWMAETQQAGGR